MFKHTYTSVVEKYILDKRIYKKVTEGEQKLLKKIEMSLLYNAFPNLKVENEYSIEYSNYKELGNILSEELVKKRIKCLGVDDETDNIFNLDDNKSKNILVSLYEYYLREEMKENISFFDIDKKKDLRKEPINEKFSDFLNNSKDCDYLCKFDEEVNNIFHNFEQMKEIYINRPTYFLLYRIRNNLLKDVKSVECSENYIKNSVKEINKFYRELYLNEYNIKFFSEIKKFDEMKVEIFNHIQEELLDWIRNGKNITVGNKLVNDFEENIKNDELYNELKQEYIEMITINDGFIVLKEKYEKFQEQFIKIAIKYLDSETKINERWLKEDLHSFLLYCVAQNIVDSDESNMLDIDESQKLELEDKTFDFINNSIAKKEKYKVFVKAENVELQNENKIKFSNLTIIKGTELKEHIDEYLNHECTMFEKDFFKYDNLNEEDVYIMADEIEAYKDDSKYVSELVIKEINDLIDILFFYLSREKSKNFSLNKQMLIIEKNSKKCLITYSSKNGAFNIPIISNKWIEELFDNRTNKTKKIIESINEYNIMKNKDVIKNDFLIKSNKKFLNDEKIYNIARSMAILIAGTNIYKDKIKYLDLRLWLIEDYIEFFNGELPDDNFIQERFLNFYKRALNTSLSFTNLNSDDLIKDLQDWILKIFPNSYVFLGKSSNDE